MTPALACLTNAEQPPPWRCSQCGRIIAQLRLIHGEIIIICRHCKAENRLERPAA